MDNLNIGKNIFSYSVYLFVFFIPISIAIAQAAAVLVIISGIFCVISGQKAERIPKSMIIFLMAFLTLVVLSSFFSPEFGQAIPQLKKSWVMLCFIPLAALSTVYSRRKAIEILIVGTAVAAALALFRFFSGDVDRAAPYSGGYTTIAVFTAAVLPLVLANYATAGTSKKRLYLIFAILMGVCLILSKTRAGWLAAFVGLMIVGFGLNWKRALVGLALTVILLTGIPRTRSVILERFESDRPGGITSGRLQLYRAAGEPLSDLPLLGYGPGSFSRLVSSEALENIGDTQIKSWHSTPLEILMESGPAALVVFLILSIIPIRQSWKFRKKTSGQTLFHTAMLASLMALYIAGLTTNLLRDFMVLSLVIFTWSVSIPYYDGISKEIRAEK